MLPLPEIPLAHALGSLVGSSRADVTRIAVPLVLPREQTAQRLVSLQRVIDIRSRSIGVLVEVSEQLSNLNAETLNLGLKRVVVESTHSEILLQERS